MSLRSHYLDKAGTLLFCNSHYATLERKCRLLRVPKHPYLRLAMTAIDILSALMLTTCGTKESVMTAKQTPWIRPWLTWNLSTSNFYASIKSE